MNVLVSFQKNHESIKGYVAKVLVTVKTVSNIIYPYHLLKHVCLPGRRPFSLQGKPIRILVLRKKKGERFVLRGKEKRKKEKKGEKNG